MEAGTARKERRTTAKKSTRKSKKKAPPKTMEVPAPVTDVLITEELPDVRRAAAVMKRRRTARGLSQPDEEGENESREPQQEPVDASLVMNTLAEKVQPKIEDNYDYSILEEFEESGHCPTPTRMVNTGCAGGEAAVFFAKREFRCVAVDSDRNEVSLARERAWLAGVDIDFMVGDLFEIPLLLPAGSFGLAVDRGAFYELEDDRDRQRYLANIRRLLFEGGVLLLSAGFFPADGSKAKRRRKRKTKKGKILLAREGGVVVNELRQAGFRLLHRILRPTKDSGDLCELILYLAK